MGALCRKGNAVPERLARVVIVGEGFGGLEAAKTLRRALVEVTLIDRQNFHCFQPLLYQVATAALSPADVAWPIRHILRTQANVTVLMAEVNGVDAQAKRVHTSLGDIGYDYLVLATGARHSYFGHDGWEAWAPGLKRIEDATRIRRNILIAFERAEGTTDPAERERLLAFVIIGGGATGVEMAGAIAEVARQTLAADFRRIDLAARRGRGDDGHPRDQLRRAWRRHEQWPRRCGHRHLGRRRDGLACRALARRGRRRRRAGEGRARPLGAASSRHLRHRRHRRGRRPPRPARARDGAAGQANGTLRGAIDRCARDGKADAGAVPLPASRRSGDDRPACGRREAGLAGIDGLRRLAVLERRAHLFPDRPARPFHRRLHLAVGLHHLPARGAAHYRSGGQSAPRVADAMIAMFGRHRTAQDAPERMASRAFAAKRVRTGATALCIRFYDKRRRTRTPGKENHRG